MYVPELIPKAYAISIRPNQINYHQYQYLSSAASLMTVAT